MALALGKDDFLLFCKGTKLADAMVSAGPFTNYEEAIAAAKDIWLKQLDVHSTLEAIGAHREIFETPSSTQSHDSAQKSGGSNQTKKELSIALVAEGSLRRRA